MSGVVVDTSVWIDFFGGRPARLLERALADGAVILSPIVVAELVSGARRPRERRAVADLVIDLPLHDTPLQHWLNVGELRARLFRAGVQVSTPDAHVAQCALDRDALLLTRDTIFERIAEHAPLRLSSDDRDR